MCVYVSIFNVCYSGCYVIPFLIPCMFGCQENVKEILGEREIMELLNIFG